MDFFDAITGGVQRELFKSTLPKPPEDIFDKIINQPKEEVELTQPSILEPEVSPLTDRAKAAAEMGLTVLNQLNRPYSAVSGGLQEVVREYKKPTKADEGVLSRAMSLGVAPFVGAVKGFATNDKNFGTVLRQVVSGENYTNAINTIDKAIADVNKNLTSVQNPAEKETLKKRLSELQDVQGKLVGLTGVVDMLKTEEGQEALEPLTGGVGQIAYDPLMFGAALLPKTAKGLRLEEMGKEAPTVMQQIGKGERTVLGFNEGATPATNVMAKLFPKTMKTVTGAADTVRGKIDEAVSAIARGASEAGEAINKGISTVTGGYVNPLRAKEELKRMVFNRTDNSSVNDAIESMVRRINKGDDELQNMIQDTAYGSKDNISVGDIARRLMRGWEIRPMSSTAKSDLYVENLQFPLDNIYKKTWKNIQEYKAQQKANLPADAPRIESIVDKQLSDADRYSLLNYEKPISAEKINAMRTKMEKAQADVEILKSSGVPEPEIKSAETFYNSYKSTLGAYEKLNQTLKNLKSNPSTPITYGEAMDLKTGSVNPVGTKIDTDAAENVLNSIRSLNVSPEINSMIDGAIQNDAVKTELFKQNFAKAIDALPDADRGIILNRILSDKMYSDDKNVAINAIYKAIEQGGNSVGKFIRIGERAPEGYKVPRLPDLQGMALKDKYADFIEQTYEHMINKRISTDVLDTLQGLNNLWKQSVTTGFILPNYSFSAANSLSEVLKNMQAGVSGSAYRKAFNELRNIDNGINTDIVKLAKEHNIIDTGFIAEDLGKDMKSGLMNIKYFPPTKENMLSQFYYDMINATANTALLASPYTSSDKMTFAVPIVNRMDELWREGKITAENYKQTVNQVFKDSLGVDNLPKNFGKKLDSEVLLPIQNKDGYLGSIKAWVKSNVFEDPFASRRIGKYTENIARLANFIDKLDRGYMPAAAAKQVAKYNFNYGDISKEMKNAKLLYPFITFQLKNVPLQLGQLFENPKALQMINKLVEAGTTDIDINEYDENAKKAVPFKLPFTKEPVAVKRFLPQASTEVAKDIWRALTNPVDVASEYAGSNLTPLKSIYEASVNTNTPGSSVTQTGGGFDTFTGRPIEQFAGEKDKVLGIPVSKKTKHVISNLVPQTKKIEDWFDAITEQGKYSPEKMADKGVEGSPAVKKAIQEVTGYRTLTPSPEGTEREERGKLQEVYRLKKLLRKYDESGEDDKFNQVEQLLEDLIDSLDENEILQYKQMEKSAEPETKTEIEPYRAQAEMPVSESISNEWKSQEMEATPFDKIIMQENTTSPFDKIINSEYNNTGDDNMSKEVATKAVSFALRNEDDSYDKNAKLENLGDGAGLTFIGLTEKYDEAHLKNKYGLSIKQLADLYKTDKAKALDIVKDTYQDLYWNKNFDNLKDERLAIRLFDLMLNRGAGGLRSILSNAGYRLENLNDYIDKQGKDTVYNNIVDSAEELYRGLKNFNRFGTGWLNRLKRSEYTM